MPRVIKERVNSGVFLIMNWLEGEDNEQQMISIRPYTCHSGPYGLVLIAQYDYLFINYGSICYQMTFP